MLKVSSALVNKIVDSSTISVIIQRVSLHPLYKKSVRTTKKYLVHKNYDEIVNIGDTVDIQESCPISKRKRWRLVAKNK